MSISRSPSGPDSAVLKEAARWLAHLYSGDAQPEDHTALQRWRQARPEHEMAWQRAQRLSQQFGAVLPAVGVPVLTRQTRMNRRAVVKTLGLLGVAVPLGWLGYQHMPGVRDQDGYRTAVGEHREVLLSDGSSVQLNTATHVDVRYSAQARLVQLRRGEIYVQTASDGHVHRPFLIETEQGRLRALGTRFTVRKLDDAAGTALLSVQEHRVEITLRSNGATRIVNAGQEVLFTADSFAAARRTQPADPSGAVRAPAWTRGALQADGMRLDRFMAELARYRAGIIRVDPDVAHLRVSGLFQLSSTDHILAIVGETLPVRIVRRTPYWVTITAAVS